MSRRSSNKNDNSSRFLCFNSLFKLLLNILPLCLFFSYYPVISLGASESMNFELSVALIWLVVFDVVVLVGSLRRKEFWRGVVKGWRWLLLPIWLSLTVIWSLNPVRGVLTAGILWLICFAVYGMWSYRGVLDTQFRARWWKWFYGSTMLVCAWCVVQCVLDLMGVPRGCSLMCAGCTYQMFGFPHPNGFAIEPQFMGNLLIAPAMVIAWILVQDNWNGVFRGRVARARRHGARALILGRNLRKPLKTPFPITHVANSQVFNDNGLHFLCFKFLLLCFFVITATLFLTFSRGAIYAFGVGMVVMSVLEVVREKKMRKDVAKRVGMVWLVVVGAFVMVLNLQGLMAQFSRTNDTYVTGVTKVLNHLSLGVIDVRGVSEEKQALESGVTGVDGSCGESEGDMEVVEKPVENSEDGLDEDGQEEAVFDGYVAESTDTRLRLTGAAIEVWHGNFTTAMFGVGLGGAGTALYNAGLSPAPKEIVQNEYASLLLETGVVGIVLASVLVAMVVMSIWKRGDRGILMLLLAYGVTLFFFSGLPNALQIYLMPAVLMVVRLDARDTSVRRNKKSGIVVY